MSVIIAIGLTISIVAVIVISTYNYKTPPMYLSAKLIDTEIPINKVSPYLRLFNRLTDKELQNKCFIQSKL